MKKLSIAIAFGTFLAPFAIVSPASAGFWDAIRVINNATSTVNTIRGTVEYTRATINGLNEFLGLSNDKDRFVKDDPVATAMGLYTDWTKNLSSAEKDMVQQVLMAQASGKTTSLENITSDPAYAALSRPEQMKMSSTYMKLSRILELAQGDKNRFFAYAFCLESGEKNCK